MRIRQISLNNDSRRVILKLRQTEHSLEKTQCEMRVFVLFHVQIDELGLFCTGFVYIREINSLLIERGHSRDEFGKTFLIIQGMRLSVDSRYFHRDIIDIG